MCRTPPMAVYTAHCLTCWNWACDGEAVDAYKIPGKDMHQKRDLESPMTGHGGEGHARPASCHLLVAFLELPGECLSSILTPDE